MCCKGVLCPLALRLTRLQDLDQIEEWNEYGELKEQITAIQDFGSLLGNKSLAPELPTGSTTSSTPQRSGPPSRASSETRHISISDPKDKLKEKDSPTSESATTSLKSTETPMNVAMRQLGAEAAAKAGQKKAAAAQATKAAFAPAKAPSTTDQTPVPAAARLSTDAAVESPDTAAETTAAKTPAQLAAEGAKRTSVDKIAESDTATPDVDPDSSTSPSTEAQLVELRRSSSITKAKSRLSESTPAAESATVLEDSSAAIAVPESEVSATTSPPQRPPRQHRGSDIGEASPEEIRALEQKLSIPEGDEDDDEDDKEAKETAVSSSDAVEEAVTKGTEPQKTEPKDADMAGVSVGD